MCPPGPHPAIINNQHVLQDNTTYQLITHYKHQQLEISLLAIWWIDMITKRNEY